jgi:hypothetical protein
MSATLSLRGSTTLEPGDTVDLEVIRDPFLDDGSLAQEFIERVNRLRAPLSSGRDPKLLIGYGTRTIANPFEDPEPVWHATFAALESKTSHGLLCVPAFSPAEPSYRLFRIPAQDELTHAFVAVLSLAHDAIDGITDLVRELATGDAASAPLYVIGVAPCDLLDPANEELLRLCQRLRMSVVLHANDGRNDLLTVAGTELLSEGEPLSEITLVGCPSSKTGEGTPGITRVRIDVWAGEAEIVFRYDLGSDREPARPLQVVRPLASASRVRSSERRLYARVRELLEPLLHDPAVATFKAFVEQRWAQTGYVALCHEDGSLPSALKATRHLRYHLLLLLRERADGGHELLLSHHTPMRPPAVAHWDTLLLPAFRDVRSLLERLRDDVMRQAVEHSGDLAKRERARLFEQAVNEILGGSSPEDEDLWADNIREIATITKRKISPTNGCVTEYEYRLVTLLPFIQRDARDQPQVAKVVEWLSSIGVVSTDSGGEISLDALRADGAGLRWDPAVELVDRPGLDLRRKARKLPPGAVWFPLDEDAGLWRQCPAIVARNADVMEWTVEQLRLQRQSHDGSYPPALVMARASAATDRFRLAEPQEPFASTAERLAKVELGFLDLAGEPAYDEPEIRRVWLVRQTRAWFEGAPERGGILVLDAEGGMTRQEAKHAAPGDADRMMLRPVQRYVLKAGLARAAAIYTDVQADLIQNADPWGNARITRGGASGDAALTPPIIERLHPADWDDESSRRDFLVCDGNHRVVQCVWNDGLVMPAVAVWTPPRFPYYARPFGRLEWDATAENEQVVTPQLMSKYLPRKVHPGELLDPSKVETFPEDQWYRRYFRDLATGFGYMGGQGGRYV